MTTAIDKGGNCRTRSNVSTVGVDERASEVARLVAGGGLLLGLDWGEGYWVAELFCGGVADYAYGDDEDAEEQAVHAEDGLVFAFDHCEAEEREGEEAERDCSGESAGDFEVALQFGFADAEDDERDELKHQAAAVEHEVEGDQSLKAEAEAE